MKILFLTCALILSLSAVCNAHPVFNKVNAIIGDESYITTYGIQPDENTHKKVRLITHLLYVENLLRDKDVSHLTGRQQNNRYLVLTLLNEYASAGTFPSNNRYQGERRPCFIDANGNICAVGYLIEKTIGREAAEKINEKHQYDFLSDIDEPIIDHWAYEYGLTPEECAMIQPAYGYSPPVVQTIHADARPGYIVASGVAAGGNLALALANMSGRYKGNRTLAYIGIAAGAGEIILGAANIKNTASAFNMQGDEMRTSYKAQNNLSLANILMGSTTLVSSVLNLALSEKKERKTALGAFSYLNMDHSVTAGVSLVRKL